MACAAIAMPPILAGGFPPVYLIFPVWGLIGAAAFAFARSSHRNSD
jgi:uncharacterized protein involved in response to NO